MILGEMIFRCPNSADINIDCCQISAGYDLLSSEKWTGAREIYPVLMSAP